MLSAVNTVKDLLYMYRVYLLLTHH